VIGGGGKRAGDVELGAPSFIPSNLLTKKVTAFLRISRRRAPSELLKLGFQRTEFFKKRGMTIVTLHRAKKGASSTRFNPTSGNIAAVLLPGSFSDCSELAVFDTGRDRIGATRIPSPRSLDDPDSPLSRLLEVAPNLIQLGAHAAHSPQVGSLMAKAFPLLTEQARQQHGTSTNEDIRVANLEISLSSKASCIIRTGRGDREFDPPDWTDGVTHEQRWQYVMDMLGAVTADLNAAWNDFILKPDMAKLPRGAKLLTERVVQKMWENLTGRSMTAYKNGMMWPLDLRLLGLDDGAAQFVRRAADGRQP
jgi:hypothetical protein